MAFTPITAMLLRDLRRRQGRPFRTVARTRIGNECDGCGHLAHVGEICHCDCRWRSGRTNLENPMTVQEITCSCGEPRYKCTVCNTIWHPGGRNTEKCPECPIPPEVEILARSLHKAQSWADFEAGGFRARARESLKALRDAGFTVTPPKVV